MYSDVGGESKFPCAVALGGSCLSPGDSLNSGVAPHARHCLLATQRLLSGGMQVFLDDPLASSEEVEVDMTAISIDVLRLDVSA